MLLKHGILGLGPQHSGRKVAMAMTPGIPAQGQETERTVTACPSFRFSERTTVQGTDEEEESRPCKVRLWPQDMGVYSSHTLTHQTHGSNSNNNHQTKRKARGVAQQQTSCLAFTRA